MEVQARGQPDGRQEAGRTRENFLGSKTFCPSGKNKGAAIINIEISASLKLRGVPDHLTELFIQENTFDNPQYEQLKRMGF